MTQPAEESRTWEEADREPERPDPLEPLIQKLREQREATKLYRDLSRDYPYP